jgi:hypothetical protein
LNDVDFNQLKQASTLAAIPNYQFLPYFINNEHSTEARRYLLPIEEWQFRNKAYKQIIDKISGILN